MRKTVSKIRKLSSVLVITNLLLEQWTLITNELLRMRMLLTLKPGLHY